MQNDVDLSIVIPISDRYDSVQEIFREYNESLASLEHSYEFVYVLDGEMPGVLAELESLQQEGEPIKIVALTKCFGEATALSIGFDGTKSRFLLTLPAYYQVQPSDLPKVLEGLEGNDMIVARRWPRTDSLFNRIQTAIFSWLVKLITGSTFRDFGCGVRAMDRRVIEEIPLYGDQHRFLPILANRRGFRVKEVDLLQSPKERYRRIYSFGVYPRRLLDILTIFFLVKFTKKPLRFFGLLGSGLFFIGFVFLVYIVSERLFFGVPLADRPAMVLSSLLVVLGIQLFALGLIGELIIFTHAKDLKEYTIERVVK